jgi:FO synthase
MSKMKNIKNLLTKATSASGSLADHEVLQFAEVAETGLLTEVAADIRDQGFQNLVSYSRKVFIPLTHLCRDVCHYCTFAQVPRKIQAPYLTREQVLEIARQGAKTGCKEALFTLGDKPELRYKAAREGLQELGHESTLSYLAEVAEMVFDETGLLPHLNPGLMTLEEIEPLRALSVSMGIMLESASLRLTEKGMPHYGSPDKIPERRYETMRNAGQAAVPFTSGILIGIGETRRERLESLLALRDIHDRYGNIQEIIVQNFRAKPDTLMAHAPEPDLNELLWTSTQTNSFSRY